MFPKPSAQFERWVEGACLQARIQWHRERGGVIAAPFTLRARFFRKTASGDLDNFLSAVCDMLQAAQIITNDRLVAAFDGSRLYVDSKNPRVEIDIIEGVLSWTAFNSDDKVREHGSRGIPVQHRIPRAPAEGD